MTAHIDTLILAAMHNIQAHGRLCKDQLMFLLASDRFTMTCVLDILRKRMLITRNHDGSYSPRPAKDGLYHPKTFEIIDATV